MVMGSGPSVSDAAVQRMLETFDRAHLPERAAILNAFGSPYAALDAMVAQAASHSGHMVMSPQEALERPDEQPTVFVGSPDRLFALMQAGYGAVLTHALVGGGAVFPLVHVLAQQNDIALCDFMSDPAFGPYAIRSDMDGAYAILMDVALDVVRPGSQLPVPHGMIGEVVLSDPLHTGPDQRTGILSAFEQVPHRFREPGLMGWMGFAQPAVGLEGSVLRAGDIAAFAERHDEILDARLMMPVTAETDSESAQQPVLEVETEAGAWIEAELLESFETLTGLRPLLQRVSPARFSNTGRTFGLLAA